MIQNFTKEKKEYLRIASRFLKEVGLYDLWLGYCYGSGRCDSWKRKEKLTITDILGCTAFTGYVNEHRPDFNTHDHCIYELFGEYVVKMYPEYAHMVYERSHGVVMIDNEKKKVIIWK